MSDRKMICIALAVILICSCLWIALLEHPQWVQDPPAAETSLPDVAFIASDVPAGSCLDPDGTFYRCSAHPMDCVVTMGADGLLVRTATRTGRVPGPSVQVVDASGAGDAFAAGLIVGLLEGWELERALVFASKAGALACTALGCSAGISDREQVMQQVATL